MNGLKTHHFDLRRTIGSRRLWWRLFPASVDEPAVDGPEIRRESHAGTLHNVDSCMLLPTKCRQKGDLINMLNITFIS